MASVRRVQLFPTQATADVFKRWLCHGSSNGGGGAVLISLGPALVLKLLAAAVLLPEPATKIQKATVDH